MFGADEILNNADKSKEFLFEEGYIHIKNVLNNNEIIVFEDVCEEIKAKPSPFKIHKKDDDGEFFMDFNNWRKNSKIFEICKNPKIIKLVKSLSGSQSCYLMHEDIIIKEGNMVQETPVHHDRPYFVTKGELNLSIWITSSGVSRSSSLLMYAKSHKRKELFLPKNFLSGSDSHGYKNLDKDIFTPLNDKIISEFEEVDFEMDEGDAIVFFHNTLHSSKKHTSNKKRNSLVIRYLMDGSTLTKKYYNNVPPYERMGLKIEENGKIPEQFFPRLA